MHIPSYLNLEQRQIDKLKAWLAGLPKWTIEEHDANFGGASIGGSLCYIITPDSICDSLIVEASCPGNQTFTCDLTIDDDNELAPWDK